MCRVYTGNKNITHTGLRVAVLVMEELEQDNPYRVHKISARRGWAIDQIRFEYTDGKIWSVGIHGGRKDNRDFIMTRGEYIVRVTHEKLPQRFVP